MAEQVPVDVLAGDRLPDWETRLSGYLTDAMARVRAGEPAFCALFAGGAVEALVGVDPSKAFRGRLKATSEVLEETLDGLFAERPVALARRGDLAWYDGSVGVVIGDEALFVADRDLVRVARSQWAKAWSVGA